MKKKFDARWIPVIAVIIYAVIAAIMDMTGGPKLPPPNSHGLPNVNYCKEPAHQNTPDCQ